MYDIYQTSDIIGSLFKALLDRDVTLFTRFTFCRKAEELRKLEEQLLKSWMGWRTSDWGDEERKQQFLDAMSGIDAALASSKVSLRSQAV